MRTLLFLFIFLFGMTFSGVIHSPVFAQLSDEETAAGLDSCFEYYDYGKVGVNLATTQSRYKPGETASIIGTIVNENTFPLVNVVVYAQLRRTNTTGNVVEEGHHLIERKQITAPMNLLPKESRSITSSFPLLTNYPSGSYQLQYYIFSPNGFHYSGRPFLEEDYGGNSFFDIAESTAPLVHFNLSSIKVNQQPYPIRGATQEFADNTLTLSASVTDTRPQKTDIPVEVKFYAFEDTLEEYLVSTQQKTLSAQTGTIDVQFQPPSTGAYVMVLRMNTPTVSEIKYRFAKINGGAPALRINDIGTTAYPPTQTDKAYVCIHSPAPTETPITLVNLRILDSNKKLLREKTITRAFTGNVVALGVPFGAIQNPRDFWVQSTLEWQTPQNEKKTKTLEFHYTCDTFQSSPKDLTVSFESQSSTLAIGALNHCDQTVRTGGHVESVRIKNDKGETAKEIYNTESITQDIDVTDLPPGNYVAEVRSGDLTKDVSFMVAGSSAKTNQTLRLYRILLLILMATILVTAAIVYYRRKKHRHI